MAMRMLWNYIGVVESVVGSSVVREFGDWEFGGSGVREFGVREFGVQEFGSSGILLMGRVVVSKRGEERVLSGHPWVYRSDVVKVDAEAGAIVRVESGRGQGLGDALFSDRS